MQMQELMIPQALFSLPLLRCFLPSQGRSRRFTVFVSSMNPSGIQIKPKILTHKPKRA